MKELKFTGLDGTDILKCLIDVRGQGFMLELSYPIYYPISVISLIEVEKEAKDD